MIAEVALFVLVLIIFQLWRNQDPPGLPPGPRRFPLIGSVVKLNTVADNSALRDQYGDILRVGFGSNLSVLIFNYKLAREAYNKLEVTDRPQWSVFGFLGDGVPGVLARNGEPWLKSRRFHLKNLRDLGMGKSNIVDAIHHEAKLLVEDFHKYTDKPNPFPQSINIAILNIVWQLVASVRYDLNDPKISEFLTLIKEYQSNVMFIVLPDIFPWLNYLPNKLVRRLTKKDWHEKVGVKGKALMMEVVEDHKKSLDPANPRDVIDNYLIELENESDPDVFSEDGLIRDIFDLFAAGFDTTTNTIKWTLLYLAAHPEVQRKVQEEIDSVVGRDTLPSLLHRSRLPYLEAVLHEILRLVPPGVSGVPHIASTDVQIANYIIPKGTLVVAVIGSIHRDPRYWENPEEFYPDRFLDESGNFSVPKEGFLPFSIGKRTCLGEALARMELYLFVGALLQNFSFAPPEGNEINLKPMDLPGVTYSRVQDLIITSRT